MSRKKRKEREFQRRQRSRQRQEKQEKRYNSLRSKGRSVPKITKVGPRTEGQREYMRSIRENKLTLCTGPAGTGKTLIAAALAYQLVKEGDFDQIIIARPAIPACNEKLGFLPGGVDDKMGPYTIPVLYNLSKLVPESNFKNFVRHCVKVVPMAFMRGMTFDNCVIILDEAQNTSCEQMKMFLTRLGEDCKAIVEGDEDQTDIRRKNGLTDAIDRCDGVEDVGIVEMDESDIVRSDFVARILERYK